jgi:hypothetical protein
MALLLYLGPDQKDVVASSSTMLKSANLSLFDWLISAYVDVYG